MAVCKEKYSQERFGENIEEVLQTDHVFPNQNVNFLQTFLFYRLKNSR